MGKTENSPRVSLAEAAKIIQVNKSRVRQILASGRLGEVHPIQFGGFTILTLDRAIVEAFAALDRPIGNRSGLPRTGKNAKKIREKTPTKQGRKRKTKKNPNSV